MENKGTAPDVEIQISGDGSHTLYVPELNETYHSHHGAIAESTHVFIHAGLEHAIQDLDDLTILEVGFGTGLNALLTLMYAEKKTSKHIRYITLEPFPLSWEVVSKLNHVEQLGIEQAFFRRMHQSDSGKEETLLPNFTFTKIHSPLIFFQDVQADLIFYDAFAPGKQAEMWSLEQLRHVKSLMKPQSTLVTYCSKGQFKRDLRALNFLVQELPGPPGKREMTRAVLAESK